MSGTGTPRDPLSVMFDAAALRVLASARSRRGGWFGTRIADPTPAQRAAIISMYGIDPLGPDNPSTDSRRGGLNARSRWGRAFVRAVNYHSPGPVQVEVGRHLPARGIIPAGRAVRVRTRRGAYARTMAERKPDTERIWTDDGQPGARFSRISKRDWL